MRKIWLSAAFLVAGAAGFSVPVTAQVDSATQGNLFARGAAPQVPVQLADRAPDRYVVVPGDTLWGIAGRFLKDPYRWPDVWEPNKADIKNPNRIYPGNIVVLDRAGSVPRLRLATVKVEPRVRTSKDGEEIASIPAAAIEPFLAAPLVVEEGGLTNAPKIVATQQGRVYLGKGDLAYVRGNVPDNVASWQVYRPGKAFIDPDTKETLGYEATFLGTAKLERKTDPMTFIVTDSKQEMGSGDRLIPTTAPALVNYTPRAPATDIRGRVLSTYGGVNESGSNQIITLSKGKRDGVELGHVFALYTAGQTVRDRSEALSRATTTVTLPDERNGLVFVFRVFDKVSYALVMSATQAIRAGDVARKP
jgi:nucleoid-associated protein YgaU